jgi:hypothetical protein
MTEGRIYFDAAAADPESPWFVADENEIGLCFHSLNAAIAATSRIHPACESFVIELGPEVRDIISLARLPGEQL